MYSCAPPCRKTSTYNYSPLHLTKDDPPSNWRTAINNLMEKEGVKIVNSDGSREKANNEEWNVGAGWHRELWSGGKAQGSAYIRSRDTVWDGEIRGFLGALRATKQNFIC